LFQVALARALAERFGRRLVVDPVLLSSRLRRLRGVTPRFLSPLLAQLLPEPQATPWHRQARARLAARLASRRSGGGPVWALTDAGLARAAAEGDPLERLGGIRLLRTHATHPALYGPAFESAWRAIATALQPLAGPEPPALAAHVRRGDYLHPRAGFFPLPAEYYRRALALGGIGWELRVETGGPEDDLARLASARALILSNSSFSAVAAHLARLRDPSTPVVCPDRWLLREDGRLGDLRGPDWLVVEA